MLKRIVVLMFVLSATFFSVNAHAIGVGVTAGVYLPAESDYDFGYQFGVYADWPLVPLLVDMRLSVTQFHAEGDRNISVLGVDYKQDLKFSSTGVRLLAILAPPVPIVKPYLGAGYGVYSNKLETTSSHPLLNHSDTTYGSGVVLQAGVGMSLLPFIGIGIHGEYFVNDDSGFDFGGYTLGLGLSVGF